MDWREVISNPGDERWAEEGADQERISAGDFINAAILCVKTFICAWSVLRNVFTQNELFCKLKQRISKEFETFLVENEQRYKRSLSTAEAAAVMEKQGRHADAVALKGLQTQLDSILEMNKAAHNDTRTEVRAAVGLPRQCCSWLVISRQNFQVTGRLPTLPLKLAVQGLALPFLILQNRIVMLGCHFQLICKQP